MRGKFGRRSTIVVGVLLVATACGPSSGSPEAGAESGPDEPASSATPTAEDTATATPTETTEPQSPQDLCAELDADTIAVIEQALGGETDIAEYTGTPGAETYIPPVDKCELTYTGRPDPEPEKPDGAVIENGSTTGEGEIRFRLTSVPITPDQFQRIRERELASAKENHAEAKELSGLGDAAFYSELTSMVLIGDRVLGIDIDSATEKQIVAIAEAVLPTVRSLPPAPAEVALPPCDPLTEAARAALNGADIAVRRDAKAESRTFCGWANATTSFQVHVSNGKDDPQEALAELRKSTDVEKVDVGEEGYYLTSPWRQVIFRKGDYHYQAYFWAMAESETTKEKTVAAAQRFADALE